MLRENTIRLFGNGFQYISGPPVVCQLPSRSEVGIEWRYSYDIHHPPDHQVGGSAPSKMQIWIRELRPGFRYRLEYNGFIAEFTAGDEILYLAPERSAPSPGWIRRLLGRIIGR